MKKRNTAVFAVVCLAAATFGQGSLTSPGAPAPTMKSLDQVEPRIPISSAPISLTAPGSYYLTQNLSGTVTIASDNISLDLMGFAINSTQGNAISFAGAISRKNIWIHNGILLAPNANGIDFSTSKADANGRIDDLRISDCKNYGVAVESGVIIRNVQVEGTGLAAIRVHGDSRVLNCSATACGKGIQASGTGALIENNRVWGNTNNYDLAAGNHLNILLCEVPETLDWPCSVKLAGTLICATNGVDGIAVNADNVSIDLCGHALIGPGASSGHGIYQANTHCNLSVKNGKIEGWHGANRGGIYVYGESARIQGIQASTNYYGIYFFGKSGILTDCTAHDNHYYGIYANSGSSLNGCTARDNAGYGINVGDACTLTGCTAYHNALTGITAGYNSVLSDCTAYDNGNQGIHIISGCTVRNCSVRSNDGDGIYAQNYCTVRNCTAHYNVGDGILCNVGCRVVGNDCINNGYYGNGAGIHTKYSDNRIEGNNVVLNDRGIDVDRFGNFIARNTASGNTTNWTVVANNACLVVNATTGGAISGDSGGTAPGSTAPNANFTY